MTWVERAAEVERSVRSRYVRRLWGVPGTLLGRPGGVSWNYWWQAHLLDCLVDAQSRAPEAERARAIKALVRGIHARNLGAWTNSYYDDIAWLGLALLRSGVPAERALTAITRRLRSGWSDHAGGGIWWRRGDTYKNVPANGPAAILLARRGETGPARSMLEWMDRLLVDPATNLLWDGLYVRADGSVERVVETFYTYCQGVFLGACVELSKPDLAARTVRAVRAHLAVDGVLPGCDGGDGGLFAGILARYLALSAVRMPAAAGDLAGSLVLTSAEAAWHARRPGPTLGTDWSTPDDHRFDNEMSVQLSGWMLIEAASRLERATMAV
ncbi:glycoside hydrolase family 76 protein [Actinokineospora enzanensis]|uniref:glycoside hydrolase family 76 protein n=1 Tax=Actinokineospora enzanensis TaxID=155975 RepID=UPI000364F3FE|nr:glycoside hydrolase family 76 protein [Actinokineospora enzanensis]